MFFGKNERRELKEHELYYIQQFWLKYFTLWLFAKVFPFNSNIFHLLVIFLVGPMKILELKYVEWNKTDSVGRLICLPANSSMFSLQCLGNGAPEVLISWSCFHFVNDSVPESIDCSNLNATVLMEVKGSFSWYFLKIQFTIISFEFP